MFSKKINHPTVDDRLTLAEAARLMVERCFPTEAKRQATGRARKRITDAVKRGDLSRINDKYRLGDFVAWARRQRDRKGKWSCKFDDLPAIANLATLPGGGTRSRLRVTLTVIPEGAADREALIIKQQAEIDALRDQNKALRDENDTLRAAEERRKNINIKKGKRTV